MMAWDDAQVNSRKYRNKNDENDYPQHVLGCGVVECQSEIVDVRLEGIKFGGV